MSYVYGPVISRRLGLSLGVDPLPLKTCNLNCIYCQLGPTHSRQGTSPVYPPVSNILDEISEALTSAREVDHVTVSGSGEPSLHEGIGRLLCGIKALTRIPVAVITNGVLLASGDTIKALCQADVVLPSLDAAERRAYNRIARPPRGLSVESVIAGLVAFRRRFIGQLWLEVMLVRGINDTREQLDRLKTAIDTIKPDRVHLNTVVRPPAAEWARPLSPGRLAEIASYFGPCCEVIADHPKGAPRPKEPAVDDMIIEAVKRRPMTMYDLAQSLGALPAHVSPCVAQLVGAGVVRSRLYQGRLFYLSSSGDEQQIG